MSGNPPPPPPTSPASSNLKCRAKQHAKQLAADDGGGGGAATLYIGCGGTSNSGTDADVSNAAAAQCSLHLSASTWVQNSAAAASGALLDCAGSSGCRLSVEGSSFLGNTQDYGTAGEDPGRWNNTDKVC